MRCCHPYCRSSSFLFGSPIHCVPHKSSFPPIYWAVQLWLELVEVVLCGGPSSTESPLCSAVGEEAWCLKRQRLGERHIKRMRFYWLMAATPEYRRWASWQDTERNRGTQGGSGRGDSSRECEAEGGTPGGSKCAAPDWGWSKMQLYVYRGNYRAICGYSASSLPENFHSCPEHVHKHQRKTKCCPELMNVLQACPQD